MQEKERVEPELSIHIRMTPELAASLDRTFEREAKSATLSSRVSRHSVARAALELGLAALAKRSERAR